MSETTAFDDPAYRAAAVDLLGVLAYGELTAFERIAEDAKLAPTLDDKAQLAHLATTEFGHFLQLRDRLVALGVDPMEAMQPFVTPLDAFHDHTAPSDWLEGLVKAYVGDGLANDFYREVASFVDAETRALVLEVFADSGQAEFVVDRVRAAIEEDPKLGGRLALWGRRLVGEALSQAQRIAADRDSLAALLAGSVDRPGLDLAAIGRMFTRLTEAHTARMTALGLQPPSTTGSGGRRLARTQSGRLPRVGWRPPVMLRSDSGLAVARRDDRDHDRGADDLDQVLDPVRAVGVLDTEEVGDQATDEGADAAAQDGPAEADVLLARKHQSGQWPEDDSGDETDDDHPDPESHGSSLRMATCGLSSARGQTDHLKRRSHPHRARCGSATGTRGESGHRHATRYFHGAGSS